MSEKIRSSLGHIEMIPSNQITSPSGISSGISNIFYRSSDSSEHNENEFDLSSNKDIGIDNELHNNSIDLMNSSQLSTTSNDSIVPTSVTKQNINLSQNIKKGQASCRFPKLEECAHFHYERVQLGPLSVRLADDKSDILNTSIASQSLSGDIVSNLNINNHTNRLIQSSNFWFIIKVVPSRSDAFFIKRSFENLRMFDEMLHRCVYDRKISLLKDLDLLEIREYEDIEYAVAKYLERFSKIASDSLTCGTILTWLQLDNKGRRLPLADTDTMRSINTPAVGAAYGVRRYTAQACDEISIEVGDMISVIDMPSPAESIWWRGKKSHLQKSIYEVGFFPQSCVATIGDKVPRHFPLPAPLVGQLDVSPTKPVLRKHGKLIAFFRSFILSRPSRRRLKQSGIYKERVFSCDLSEHLLNSGQEIPMVLKCCAEFIEEHGIVDGIYRLSGITSNIQKLRRAFDEERIPDLTIPEIKQDIHAVSSLLKMYFRELPNPLCTYQLYDNFVEAIQSKSDPNERLRLMKETVLKLPPPHYRTLKYLAMHLGNIAKHCANTGMTDKNLAIVWAPNLLRSPSIESGGVAALRGVGIQAVVTEYLIKNSDIIFDSTDDYNKSQNLDPKLDSLTDCESLLIEQREHDQSLTVIERPKSLSAGGAKLISLEEAQERHSRIENSLMADIINNKSMPINTLGNVNLIGSYIEVGGGPSSLPDKYHTVLPVPRSWQKRKTHSWKSLFSRNSNTRNSTSSTTDKLNPSLPKQKSVDSDDHQVKKESDITTDDKQLRNLSAHNRLQEKQKSVDLLDAKPNTEVFVRSNSVDSLRTGTGHSRSVSHDSYFDLLQSPTRGTNCSGSREFSELGLNFDREEPEMRIFSESESLVSSPKVYGNKENIPPPARRILRARPEDFSSATNSVNPSPKKQPRLNFLNPNDITQSWVTNDTISETIHKADDPSCKRSKLEEQLSDIQYIDCNTPEHMTTNTLCTSAQVHNQPLSKNSSLSGDINEDGKDEKKNPQNTTFELVFDNKNTKSSHIITRYSYPVVQKKDDVGSICKRKESESPLKERFSYPGLANSNSLKNINQFRAELSEKAGNKIGRTNSHNISEELQQSKPYYSISSPKIPTINYNNIYKSTSNEVLKDQKNEMESSKISAATSSSSPIQSPRYSLLVGDTSSENSSAVNTPIFEMDPLNKELFAEESEDFERFNLDNYNTKELCINELNTNTGTTPNLLQDKINKRNISIAKKELTLELDSHFNPESGHCNKIESIDLAKPKKQLITSPNNSNLTHTSDTSQSVTPSEFGYQYLNHPTNAISSISTTTTDSSPILNSCENLAEQTFSNYQNDTLAATPICPVGNLISPIRTPTTPTSTNPLKSTISITYKSPIKAKLTSPLRPKIITGKENSVDELDTLNDDSHSRTLLETNFDENIVYEQVKFFKNSVSEINEILNNVNKFNDMEFEKAQETEMDISPSHKEINSNSVQLDEEKNSDSQEDILMSDDVDSLEMEQSLYENVELRKRPAVYENMDLKSQQIEDGNDCKLEVDSLECDAKIEDLLEPPSLPPPQRSPSSFSVKQLATKFETSPVDVQPPFDFGFRSSKKIEQTQNNNASKQLNKYSQHTRSLDENAFIREFGRQQHQQQKRYEDLTKSVQQIDETRKSFDFTTQLKPKTLNPPKRLPGAPFDCNREKPSSKLKLDLEKVDELTTRNYRERDIRITPTTENRICLIQQNNLLEDRNDESLTSTNLSNSLKVLSGVKLDRDRIERIKEERRHQLHEKYRTESFKSKSKTELREFPKDEKPHSESLRIKSKSRGDVRQLHKETNNTEVMQFSDRIRRSSDEKNHNNQEITTIYKEDKPDKFQKLSIEVKSNRTDKPVPISRSSISSTREKISMFESRSQNQ